MSSITLTLKEMELLKAIGKFFQTSAVDWKVVAEECGYKLPKGARDKWYPLRDKLFGKEGESGSPKKKAGPTKRKAAGEDGEKATPAKKSKKGKKADTPVEDDEDAEAEAVKDEPEGEEYV